MLAVGVTVLPSVGEGEADWPAHAASSSARTVIQLGKNTSRPPHGAVIIRAAGTCIAEAADSHDVLAAFEELKSEPLQDLGEEHTVLCAQLGHDRHG
jgi:hypothetical protein